MLEYLDRIDHHLFEFVQLNFRSDFLDPVFLAFRDKYFWIPFYIFLLSGLFFKFNKKAWRIILVIILTITLTDQFNSNLLKKYFQRTRPCNEIYFKDQFKTVIDCSGGWSFPSSHATNHMGIASFLFFSCGVLLGRFRWLLFVWAILVGISQIYIGVHFPFDVVAGWIEGLILGILVHLVFRKFLSNTA